MSDFLLFAYRSEMTRYPNYLSGFYFKTWTHLPQYLVGILLGRIMMNNNHERTLRPVTVVAFWAASLAAIVAVVYGLVPYLDEQSVPKIPHLVRVSYGSLHQLAWSLALGWIIWACTNGYGGLVNELLSWKAFAPLARLSYGVFLVHYNWIRFYYAGLFRSPRDYLLLDVAVVDYLAILAVSFGLSFVLCVAVEMPFLRLDRVLFSRSSSAAMPLLISSSPLINEKNV